MAELLIIINPNASNREAGDVCVIQEDGWPWSELERKQFVVVRVPLTKEEAEAKYLKPAIPKNILDAHQMASEAFLNAKNDEERKQARFLIDATRPRLENYPHRRFNLDVTKLPTEAVDTAKNTKIALENAHSQAKARARQRVDEELVKQNGSITPVGSELTTAELLRATEILKGDKAKDDLIMASRAGRFEIIQPILDAIPVPPVVVLDQVELDDMTIEKP